MKALLGGTVNFCTVCNLVVWSNKCARRVCLSRSNGAVSALLLTASKGCHTMQISSACHGAFGLTKVLDGEQLKQSLGFWMKLSAMLSL